MTTTREVAHRVRQARKVAWRAELALTLAQLLWWASLLGGAVAALLWVRRRLVAGARTRDEGHVSETFAPVPEPGKVQQDNR